MLEKSKLKKKSKYLKKPLQLKNTVSESLAHNVHPQSILKKEASSKPTSKPKLTTLEKDIRLQHLYHQVELQQKSDSDSDNSEEMLLLDLEKHEEEDYENKKGKRDKKTLLFSHLMKNTGKLGRKLSVLEEKVNQKIQKCSVEAKFKQMSGQRASHHQQENRGLMPRALQRSVARMSEEGITEVRLANMQLTHLSLVRVKEQLSRPGKLKILDLSYNGLTNKSMPVMVDILSQNVIQELSLKWNQLTYEGALQLIEAVTYNINLSSLDLSYNKLTNNSTAFIDAFLKLFAENRYLAHLNLELCHLSQEQCAILANAYNLTNQSILCLHFKGNSHYYVNKFGYITKDKNYQEIPNISPTHQFRVGKVQSLPSYCNKYLIGEDCCWLCHRWVGELFKYPQQVLPSGLISPENIEYFIHISCYDYQPIRLSIQECINSVQKRTDCKRIEWANYEIHMAQIPIPCNKDLKYFFTLNGRALINQNQPSIEVNETINFEIFDVFAEIYAERPQTEKYSVFVSKINTRSKDEFGYNKQKKMQEDLCHQNIKDTCNFQNKKALKTILSKDKIPSIHTPLSFEPLPRISKTKPNTPINSRLPSPSQRKQNNFKMIVNIRKCKEKSPPTTIQSEKYLNLGITPRNKHFLFNYSYFKNNRFTHQDVVSRRHQFKQVQTKYFGSFKETYLANFLRRYQTAKHEGQFMDKFKILTRKYFNSNQLLFSDIFSFIYSTFVSIGSPNALKDSKQLDRKNKSVKFVSPAPKETKLSINVNSEKNLQGKTITSMPIGGVSQQKGVQRHALSMNCISDKYQLTKLRSMPAGSIHTLHTNALSTDKTLKSIKDITNDPGTLAQLSLDNIPTPLDLAEDILTHYCTLATRYARERRVIFELINGFERNCDKQKLKELNEIIQTYNYYKLAQYYEQTVQNAIEELFDIKCFSALGTYFINPLLVFLSLKRSSIATKCLQAGADELSDLEALQKQVQSQSVEDAFQSFSTYLNNEEHRIKVIKRAESMTMKSSKKRKGKYGRSLKNIKQELLGEQNKLVLPADSDKFVLQIQQQQIKRRYNELVVELNVISDIFLEVLDQLIAKYLDSHNCGEEVNIIDQWLRSHLSSRIASFISDLMTQYRAPTQMAKLKQRSAEICEHFALNSIMELTRASVMLGSSVMQQNLKEYQFISPFHSYEFIIGIEITKLTHITHAIQESPFIVQQHLADVLRLLASAWTKYELDSIQKEKTRKQAEFTRKMKRIKTINESIERGIPGQEENQQ